MARNFIHFAISASRICLSTEVDKVHCGTFDALYFELGRIIRFPVQSSDKKITRICWRWSGKGCRGGKHFSHPLNVLKFPSFYLATLQFEQVSSIGNFASQKAFSFLNRFVNTTYKIQYCRCKNRYRFFGKWYWFCHRATSAICTNFCYYTDKRVEN